VSPRSASIALALLAASSAFADELPYTLRTHDFNGWSPTARGDIRTVGMAGATVGLGDTFIAATDNPAGLAMTLDNADTNFTYNAIHDSRVQDFAIPVSLTSFGAAMTIYPWGFAFGYVTPSREGQEYLTPTGPAEFDVTNRELVFSVARVFAQNRISLGAELALGQAVRSVAPDAGGGTSLSTYSASGTVSAMIRLRNRFLVGLSYSTPMHYAGDPTITEAGLTSFYQGVQMPARFAAGLGWIPNRFIRGDFTVGVVGDSAGTALLRDDSQIYGSGITIQPKLGGAYLFCEFDELKGTVFGGTYLESARIEGTSARLHATGGLEAKLWVVSAGAALDLSSGYQNRLFSVGIDAVRALEKLELIPKAWHPKSAGWLPRIDQLSDDALARPLQAHWEPHGPSMNPIEVTREIPQRIEEKFEKTEQQVKDLWDSVSPPSETEKPAEVKKQKASPKKKKKPKKKPKPKTSESPAEAP
jgi:hypothetical protein